jgi:hypothetical protein
MWSGCCSAGGTPFVNCKLRATSDIFGVTYFIRGADISAANDGGQTALHIAGESSPSLTSFRLNSSSRHTCSLALLPRHRPLADSQGSTSLGH